MFNSAPVVDELLIATVMPYGAGNFAKGTGNKCVVGRFTDTSGNWEDHPDYNC